VGAWTRAISSAARQVLLQHFGTVGMVASPLGLGVTELPTGATCPRFNSWKPSLFSTPQPTIRRQIGFRKLVLLPNAEKRGDKQKVVLGFEPRTLRATDAARRYWATRFPLRSQCDVAIQCRTRCARNWPDALSTGRSPQLR
jgi:hypothetical protein